MLKLLWAERQKIRRSKMLWVAFFAVVMVTIALFVAGQDIYNGSEAAYIGSRYIDNPGWYMMAVQSWATFFVLPAVIALLGSYMICREEQENTIISLRIIPVNEAKLTTAKMVIAFVVSILLYLLLFVITFLTEAVLHFSDLSIGMALEYLLKYLLDGAGIFLVISPIISLMAHRKNGYWIALVFTEVYSFTGLFAGMSRTLTVIYPITAVFNFSGHYTTTAENRVISTLVVLLCGGLAAIILKGLSKIKET